MTGLKMSAFEVDHDIEHSDNRQLLGEGYIASDLATDFQEELDNDIAAMATATEHARALAKAKRGCIILPDSEFRRRWIQLVFFICLYIVWVTPVQVGFNMPAQGFWFWLEGFINIFFIADIIVNFLTAYEDPANGELIISHKKIALRYMKGWFIIDLLATIPVDFIVRGIQGTWQCSIMNNCSSNIALYGNQFNYLLALRFLRIFRILWIVKNFGALRLGTILGQWADDLYKMTPWLTILELLIVLLYLGHISGCFFYMLSMPAFHTPSERTLIEEGELDTWILRDFGSFEMTLMPTLYDNSSLPENQVMMDPATGVVWMCPNLFRIDTCSNCAKPRVRCHSMFTYWFRYITTMYWAYTTMTTVGYGDISGTTIAEKIWAIITMIIAGFFFSFCLGRMALVVSKLDADRQAKNERLEGVSMFLKDVELPRALSKRVLEFFKRQYVKPYDRQRVLSLLPFELRSKILRHLYGPAIQKVPILKHHADNDMFVTDVCIRLQPYTCSAENFVYQRGESSGDVYVLLSGDMHVVDIDQETFLFKIPEGTVFGEATVLRQLEGLNKAKRTENVWCKTTCEMLRIAQEDMVDLLEQYPSLLKALKKLSRARHYRMQLVKRSMHTSRLPKIGGVAGTPEDAAGQINGFDSHASTSLGMRNLSGGIVAGEVEAPGARSGDSGYISLRNLSSSSPLLFQETMDHHGATVRAIPSPLKPRALPASDEPLLPEIDPAAPAILFDVREEEMHKVLSAPNMLSTRSEAASEDRMPLAGGVEGITQELRLLRKMVQDMQQNFADELYNQRYLIYQVPGRIMNHMVMVTGNPTEEQRKELERATLEWNSKFRWQI